MYARIKRIAVAFGAPLEAFCFSAFAAENINTRVALADADFEHFSDLIDSF